MTSNSGIERIRFTYAAANNASGLNDDKRASASKVPNATPPTAATTVNCNVYCKPVKRYGHVRPMTSKSRSPILAPRNIPGDSNATLDQRHHAIGGHRNDYVDQRRG